MLRRINQNINLFNNPEKCFNPGKRKMMKYLNLIDSKGFIYLLKQHTKQPHIGYFVNSFITAAKIKPFGEEKIGPNLIQKSDEEIKDKILTKLTDENKEEITECFLTEVIDNMKSDDNIKKMLKETRVRGTTLIEKFLGKMKNSQNTQDQNFIYFPDIDENSFNPFSENFDDYILDYKTSINCLSENENMNDSIFDNDYYFNLN